MSRIGQSAFGILQKCRHIAELLNDTSFFCVKLIQLLAGLLPFVIAICFAMLYFQHV